MASSIAEMLRSAALRRPDHIGLVDGDERLDWRSVEKRATHLAARLVHAGIEPGDRVAIYAEHGIGQAVSLFAIAMAGGVFTIINPLLKNDQVEHQIRDADAKVVVGTRLHLDKIKPLLADRGSQAIELSQFGTMVEKFEAAAGIELPRVIPADVACLIYTSGSTGKPKGVIVPHRTLIDGGRIVSGYLKIGPDDVTCSILPLSFDYGLNQLMTATTHAARIVFHRFLFPGELFALLEREKVTGFAAVPTLWPKLLAPRFAASKPKFDALRYVTTAGGTHSQELLRRVSDFLSGAEVIVMYGLTESFRSCYLPFAEMLKRPGSIGKPVPEVDILVLDSSGAPCKTGEIGELHHRGAFVNYGYLNAPDLTEAKYIERAIFGSGCRKETIVRSGDLVSKDKDGFLYFHGRIDAQIKSMGFRISPTEVEEAAMTYPRVLGLAAIGVPNDEFGEAVVLFYTKNGHEDFDAADLKKHMAQVLPFYAVPMAFVHIEQIPQTPTGKADYQRLKSVWHESQKA